MVGSGPIVLETVYARTVCGRLNRFALPKLLQIGWQQAKIRVYRRPIMHGVDDRTVSPSSQLHTLEDARIARHWVGKPFSYSWRSATTGSTAAARRAGTHAARIAVARSDIETSAYTTGSTAADP